MKRLIRILFTFVCAQLLIFPVITLLAALGVDIAGFGMTFIPRVMGLLSLIGVVAVPILSIVYYNTNKRLGAELAIYSFICLCLWGIYIFAYFAFSGLGDGGLF